MLQASNFVALHIGHINMQIKPSGGFVVTFVVTEKVFKPEFLNLLSLYVYKKSFLIILNLLCITLVALSKIFSEI